MDDALVATEDSQTLIGDISDRQGLLSADELRDTLGVNLQDWHAELAELSIVYSHSLLHPLVHLCHLMFLR